MEVGARHSIRDTYKPYRDNREHDVKITEDIYGKIGTAFFKLLMEKVHNGDEVVLPFKLGSVYIRGKRFQIEEKKDGKIKGASISWSRTRKIWERVAEEMGITFKEYLATVPSKDRKIVYCFNENTNGYRYKIVWDKSEALAHNRQLYTLVFAKDNRRKLHEAIIAGKEFLLKD